MSDTREASDEVEVLARLFREHPAWQRAARYVAAGATSDVYFTTRPGEVWHLARVADGSRLRPGRSADPDLVFRFAPVAVERLAAARGSIGDFAVALFELLTESDPALRVDLRIRAPFARLLRRGYVRLLVAAGPKVVAFGARHGVRTLPELRSLVKDLRGGPAGWELPRDPA